MTDQKTRYEIDRDAIGTSAYKGRAFFWAHEYKHDMRDIGVCGDPAKSLRVTRKFRRRVHADIIAFGLPLDGVSDRHRLVIDYHRAIARHELTGVRS